MKAFQSIASNSIFVWGSYTELPYAGFKAQRSIQLKLGDVEIIKKRVEWASNSLLPEMLTGVFGSAGGNIVRGNKTGTYSIYGEFPEYIKIATSKIYDGGRFINDKDIDERKVCVIGERTQLELFEEDEDPIGKFISINKINFRVIGVHKFVQGGGFGDDGDIYIPFATFQENIQYWRSE